MKIYLMLEDLGDGYSLPVWFTEEQVEHGITERLLDEDPEGWGINDDVREFTLPDNYPLDVNGFSLYKNGVV